MSDRRRKHLGKENKEVAVNCPTYIFAYCTSCLQLRYIASLKDESLGAQQAQPHLALVDRRAEPSSSKRVGCDMGPKSPRRNVIARLAAESQSTSDQHDCEETKALESGAEPVRFTLDGLLAFALTATAISKGAVREETPVRGRLSSALRLSWTGPTQTNINEQTLAKDSDQTTTIPSEGFWPRFVTEFRSLADTLWFWDVLLSFPFLLELRFGSQGASRARVERLLALESCRCHRKSCYQKLASSKATLLQYLQQLWSLPKHIQDEYIKQVAGNRKGKEWFLLGKRMASKCVVAMIGFGNARMARIGKSQVDRRYKVWGLATLRQNSIHVIGISCVFIFVCLSMFVFLLACLLVCCFLSVSAKTPSFALVPEAFKKPAVKTRLINQFLLDVYSKAGGMLPDRPFGSTYLNLKLLKASCQEFCTSRFQRGGRPRKMQPEKLTVVMGSVHSEVGEAGVFRLTVVSLKLWSLQVMLRLLKGKTLLTWYLPRRPWSRTWSWKCTCLGWMDTLAGRGLRWFFLLNQLGTRSNPGPARRILPRLFHRCRQGGLLPALWECCTTKWDRQIPSRCSAPMAMVPNSTSYCGHFWRLVSHQGTIISTGCIGDIGEMSSSFSRSRSTELAMCVWTWKIASSFVGSLVCNLWHVSTCAQKSPLSPLFCAAEDDKSRFDVGRDYRDHIAQVGADRELEKFLEATWQHVMLNFVT